MKRRSVALAALVHALAACDGRSPSPPPRAPPDPCAWTTAGAAWIVFANRATGSYDLVIARTDGSCRAAVTSGPSNDLYPSWSRDGRIAFSSDRDGAPGIWVHDLENGSDARVELGALEASSPAFSPDGTRLAFEGRAPGALQTDVYVAPAAGGAVVPVAASERDDAAPAWAPDGDTLYFVSSRTGTHEVFAVSASGGDARQVTTGSRLVGRPVAAPAGDALYYARTVSGSSATEVVALELATSTIRLVSSQDDSEPAVDPSGDRLALRSFRSGTADLVLVDATDGGHPVALTDDPASDGAPAFAPLR